MRTLFFLLALLSLASSSAAGATTVIRTVCDINRARRENQVGSTFDLECIVTLSYDAPDGPVIATDGRDSLTFRNDAPLPASRLRTGDLIRIAGTIARLSPHGTYYTFIDCTNLIVLAHDRLPRPRPVDTRELNDGRLTNGELVEVQGTVVDIGSDDVYSNWATVLLENNGEPFYVIIARPGHETLSTERLIGARVSVVGVFTTFSSGIRKLLKFGISVTSLDAFRIIKPPTPAAQLPVDDIRNHDFSSFHSTTQPRRYSAIGHVVAVWSKRNLLLQTDDGHFVKGELSNLNAPGYGTRIRMTGLPETDLYTPILVRANWTMQDGPPLKPVAAESMTAERLKSTESLKEQYGIRHYGMPVCLDGIVRGIPIPGGDGIIYLENAGQMVIADVSAVPSASRDVGLGDRIKVTGTCIMDTEKTGANHLFPRINGYRIVVRTTQDIEILSHPSWWTPRRLLAVIGALLAALVGIILWNASLRHIAARKGRELLREQLGHVKADLRTEERTRLAVELHDTLAQNLTGVSMEIEAANDLRGDAPKPMLDHLGIAAKALKSCRDELRNCLWDLRSQALEETDMTKAVLKTLQPVINDSRLAVRFNVPRARLSDNTAHALLRVIRELVVNAIRHGNASSVRVAGTIDREQLLCSVTDDGCGFDPDTVPGVLQGHFGLQGIRERLDEIGGTFEITSAPGKGTKAVITLTAPTEKEQ